MSSRWEQRYWSLDLPGLTEQQANVLLDLVSDWPGVMGGTAVDPDHWLTQHSDYDTVETLSRILSSALRGEALAPDDATDAAQLLEDLTLWINSTPDD